MGTLALSHRATRRPFAIPFHFILDAEEVTQGKRAITVTHRTVLTFAVWQSVAPLAVGLALGPDCPLQDVAGVAGKFYHVIQVELGALRQPIGGIARVTTGDGYGESSKPLHSLLIVPASITFQCSMGECQ